LEYEVLTKADKVVTIGWDGARGLGRLGKRNVRVIPNGYDWDLSQQNTSEQLSKEFTITHLGVITPSRNTPQLWSAMKELKETNPDFAKNLKIKLIGQIDQSVVQNLEADGLTENTELVPYIPHDEVLKTQRSSQVLLLLINNTPNAKGILTGKLFEYLAAGRPILCIGPEDGDAARVIKETQTGCTIGFDEKEKLKDQLLEWFKQYQNDNLTLTGPTSIEQYSRKSQSERVTALLDQITQQ
jgi:glycosyltransferase involved in cell wall biosynthesis